MTDMPSLTAAPPERAVLRAALDNAPVGVGVCDNHGRILRVNDHLARLFGRDRDELVGHSFLRVIHPEELAEAEAQFRRAQCRAATGDAPHADEQSEVRCVTGAGETIWVHVTWSTSAPEPGGTQYSVAHVTDLTRRRVIEDELAETRQLLEVTLQWSAVGVIIVDPEKRIRHANPKVCDLLGYTEQQLQQHSFLDITHPDERDKTSVAFQQILNGEIDRHQTIKRYVRSDGKVLYCRRIAVAARGRDGAARSTVVLVEPIGVVDGVTAPCSSAPASQEQSDPWWRSILPSR